MHTDTHVFPTHWEAEAIFVVYVWDRFIGDSLELVGSTAPKSEGLAAKLAGIGTTIGAPGAEPNWS